MPIPNSGPPTVQRAPGWPWRMADRLPDEAWAAVRANRRSRSASPGTLRRLLTDGFLWRGRAIKIRNQRTGQSKLGIGRLELNR